MNSNSAYKSDGVDIESGDSFSSACGKICRSTYDNSPFVRVADLSKGRFRGPRGFTLRNLPEGCLSTMAADGVGSKVSVIVASGKLHTSASNVFAMTAMDITRFGGLPLVFANVLDVNSLGEQGSEPFEMGMEVMRGMKELADGHSYVVLTGETAELGICVGSDNPDAKLKFNWAGVMYGVYHPEKMIYGDAMAPGQAVIVLRDCFRSNGISSVRKALALQYGPDWYRNPEALADIIAASEPSAQYDRFLNRLHGWMESGNKQLKPLIPMRLIVHLSGGAFKSKLGEDMLAPQGLSADLYNLFDPPAIMRKCAEWRGLDDQECYSTWNGGQGALVVVDADNVRRFLEAAVMARIDARVAGKITKREGYNVRIRSKFSGKTFTC